MRDLSLHILDLAQNSVVAGARRIEISLIADIPGDRLTFSIKDNGKGMPEELLARVRSPFATTRTTRKVGLGIPMMEERAAMAGGGLDIQSKPGEGTSLAVWMAISHIDRPPLGDLAGTLLSLILMADGGLDYTVRLSGVGEPFELDTADVKEALDGVPLSDPDASIWLRDALTEALAPYHALDNTVKMK